MQKRKSNERETESNERRIERVMYSAPFYHQNLKSSMDIEWPEFTKERERIKANSLRYKNVPVSEAMCGIHEETVVIPETPILPVVGSIYKAVLTKHGNSVSITGVSAKEQVICRNNLAKYPNMEYDNMPIDAKVVALDKIRQSVTIDVLQPVFESWINRVMTDKTSQYDVKRPETITVHDLHLSNGGFLGKAEIPVMSEFVGEPYFVDAFIPGSQIVLNIEKDFSKWEGKTVDTFVAGYTVKPGSVNQMSLVCSRKSLLNFAGNLTKIELYGDYCHEGKKWESFTKSVFSGIVTGVINSSKKCGVFVELPMFNITGMIPVEPSKLVEFKAGNSLEVKITGFEQMLEYDPTTGQTIHSEPYKIENGKLKSCILKPILELA